MDMDSNETGPPPRKRFMNENGEGQGRTSESKDSSNFRGVRSGRGFRGRVNIRGRGGFRGGFRGGRGSFHNGVSAGVHSIEGGSSSSPQFRGRERTTNFRGRGSSSFRGRSQSFSSPDFQPSTFRGGRGNFSGFRGRGGSPAFRGRGGSPAFRGRGRGSGFRGRGRGGLFAQGPQIFQEDSRKIKHVMSIYNLPAEKSYAEQRELLEEMLTGYNPLRVNFVESRGDDHFAKASVWLQNEEAVEKACEEFNGRFVEDSQIIVAGSHANVYNRLNKAVVITNLPDLPTLKDLVPILHECKGIAQISQMNLKASPPYTIVFVNDDDDVKRITDKSSTIIKGSEIIIQVLDPKLVARSTYTFLYDKWEEILGTDMVYYVMRTLAYTDIYFECEEDLALALEKCAAFNQEKNQKIDLQRRVLHEFFFAEICDVEGDVNDIELYSMIRKLGEVSEFRRLDKDHYMIKQELNAAMAAMSLSDSKGCGGVLKFSWLNTRSIKKKELENSEVKNTEKSSKKKKKKTDKEKNTAVKNAATEESADKAQISKEEDVDMAEDDNEEIEESGDDDGEEEEESEGGEDEEDEDLEEEEDEDVEDEEEEDVEDEEEEDVEDEEEEDVEDEEEEDVEEADAGGVVVKQESVEESDDDQEKPAPNKFKCKMMLAKKRKLLRTPKNNKHIQSRNRRPQKRKISSSTS